MGGRKEASVDEKVKEGKIKEGERGGSKREEEEKRKEEESKMR